MSAEADMERGRTIPEEVGPPINGTEALADTVGEAGAIEAIACAFDDKVPMEEKERCWVDLASAAAGMVANRLLRVADALEQIAAQGDAAAERDAERWEWEKEARAQQVAAMERFQETVRAAPVMQPAPDWNGIMARMFRALLIREGMDPASLPEIPEDPAELPGWLERLRGMGGDLPPEGGAELG